LIAVIQENELLKSTESLVGPQRARMETEAVQAKHEMVFNLMMKRKELEAAGSSALEIDERPAKQEETSASRQNRRGDTSLLRVIVGVTKK
jgi:hypothetical protein